MKTSRFVLSVLTIASLAVSGVTAADEITKQGYLLDSQGEVVKSGFGLCWHTGFWTPDMAIEGCDLVKVVEADAPAPAPEQPVPIVITLQSDTLFGFDKSIIRAEGKKQLDDEVIGKMKEYPQIELVLVTGHADRIGSDAYNLQLSQRRADAVKDYLVEQGVDPARIQTASKGESEPVVTCDELQGKAGGRSKELIECLKPNRRVEVEIKVQQPVQR
jgi:OOP family OmpA-OmpF porin